ncbi:unnamed protein product, partial [Coregonus sp. 'balchen']
MFNSPGRVLEVARRSPFACWFSSMLYCFGGGILSALMMAEAPIAPLSKNINVLMASEVTRTWKVLGGVAQAHSKYKDGLLVMIAVGWAE